MLLYGVYIILRRNAPANWWGWIPLPDAESWSAEGKRLRYTAPADKGLGLNRLRLRGSLPRIRDGPE